MAKKFGKFMLFTAALGAACAGAYYYMQSKKTSPDDEDDFEDFDDFSDSSDDDDMDTDDMGERSYVSLDYGNGDEKHNTNASDKQAASHAAAGGAPDVEEFFDDDDDSSLDSM